MSMEKIEKLRKKIDKTDDKIIDLLNKRAKIVRKIGIVKNDLNMVVNQPEREKEILDRLKKRAVILNSKNIEAIWKEIMIACKLIQDNI